jgi:hypothetical protein
MYTQQGAVYLGAYSCDTHANGCLDSPHLAAAGRSALLLLQACIRASWVWALPTYAAHVLLQREALSILWC